MLQLSEKSLREMMEGHLRQLQHQIALWKSTEKLNIQQIFGLLDKTYRVC